MDAENPLVELVGTMNKGEKRHFKIFCKLHEKEESGGRYVELFDIVDKFEKTGRVKVFDKLPELIPEKKIPQAKYYLYQQILKSLRSYGQDKSPTRRFSNYYFDAELSTWTYLCLKF